MEAKHNSYQASTDFFVAAREQGLATEAYIFQRLKFRSNKRKLSKAQKNVFNDSKKNKDVKYDKGFMCADRSGGFIRFKDVKQIAKQLNINYHTLKGNLAALERCGFIIRQNTGWRMISTAKAAEIIGVELRRLRLKADNKKELKLKLAYSVIKHTVHRQIKARAKTSSESTGVISCQYISSKMGYKSAMTASLIERELEKQMRLIVVRGKTELLYKEADFWGETLSYFKRPCNILNPIKKTA